MIKLPDGTTKLEHRLVWEQHYGPIPPGGVIHHKNGDGRDNRVENLELMQRASTLASIWKTPQPHSGRLLAKIL